MDDKRDFDSLRIGKVRATICCLRASSDFSSLDDEGADNHEVSPDAIGPSSHDSRIEAFSWSRPEDADFSRKGADDHIGHCVSTGSLASS